jgi:hypothetical protein
MAWGYTLDLQIFGSISGELENFGSEIFQNRSDVDSSCFNWLDNMYDYEMEPNAIKILWVD